MRKIYQKMYLKNKNRSEGILGGVIDNVILHSCNSESRPLSFKRAGFTLIELLVVVLIIGILAAVAVPQYQAAVRKSRFSQLMVIGDAISKSEEIYYMGHGRYTSNVSVLDISVDTDSDKYTISMNIQSDTGHAGFNVCDYKQSICYAVYLQNHNHSSAPSGQRECRSRGGDEISERVCQSLGGEFSRELTDDIKVYILK